MRKFLSIFLILFLTACASSPTAVPAPTAAAAAPTAAPAATAADTQAPAASATPTVKPPKQLVLTIVKLDGSSFKFKVDDLKKLPTTNVNISGRGNEGYKIKDILAAAGVTTFTKISISGDGDKVRLPFNSVDDSTILSFTDSGTLRLVTTNINKQFWPQNVGLIEVQ